MAFLVCETGHFLGLWVLAFVVAKQLKSQERRRCWLNEPDPNPGILRRKDTKSIGWVFLRSGSITLMPSHRTDRKTMDMGYFEERERERERERESERVREREKERE